MIRLSNTLNAWNTPDFEQVMKQELECIDGKQLPLQQGLSHSSYANEENFRVVVLGSSDEAASIHVKTGIFYSGLIPGCNCSDDPSPDDEIAEYCEVELKIDKKTAETRVSLLPG